MDRVRQEREMDTMPLFDKKNAHYAIQKVRLPFAKTVTDEAWIKKANGYIRHMQGEYRDTADWSGHTKKIT